LVKNLNINFLNADILYSEGNKKGHILAFTEEKIKT
jgi:hypothetical protein